MADLLELLALSRAALLDRLGGLSAAERKALFPAVRRAWDAGGSSELLWLIWFATAPADSAFWPRDPDELWLVRQRGARYLQALAGHTLRALATERDAVPRFDEIRALERTGELTFPADDQYVLAMINHVGSHLLDGPSGADLLRADPELLERAFWRIFEVEGNQQVSLAGKDRYGGAWQRTVLELLADGTIDRARVLDATIAALGRGFSAFRSRWFLRLHEELHPQLPETTERQAEYAAMLRAPTAPTVALALTVLGGIAKAGRLDAPMVGPGLAAAVHAPAKATAIRALRLADRLPSAAGAVAAALHHPDADVQATALRLLQRRDDAAGRQAVRAALGSLAPAVAADARAWLGLAAATYRAEAGVDHPGTPLRPVAPITDPAELAEAFAVLLADPGDAELLERALGAAARLGPDPDRYAGLARRAARQIGGWPTREFGLLPDVVGRVVLAAARAPRASRQPRRPPAPLMHLAERAATSAAALRTGQRYAPCAEPTHEGGWIAPSVLVERLLNGGTYRLDAVAALLRLGPDPLAHTDPALVEAASGVPGSCGAALRYALGSPLPDRVDPADRPLWIAAARARAPYDDDPALLRLGADFDLPGAGRAPAWRVHVEPSPYREPVRIDAAEPSPAAGAADPLLPTLDLAAIHAWTDRPLDEWYDWLATVWPGNIAAMLVVALAEQQFWLWGSSRVAPASPGLGLLARTAAALPPMAAPVLAAGLGMPTLAQRTPAVDAAVALLPHRLTPTALAAAMATLANVVPLPRWADSLRDAATAGRGTEIRALLTALLPALEPGTRGLHTLLGLLHDEHLRSATPVTDPALRAWLAAVPGSGAAARSARLISALPAP